MKKESLRTLKDLAYYSSIGLSMVLSIFIGLAVGIYLDRKVFNTTPWLTLIFLGLGKAENSDWKDILWKFSSVF